MKEWTLWIRRSIPAGRNVVAGATDLYRLQGVHVLICTGWDECVLQSVLVVMSAHTDLYRLGEVHVLIC